jgi:hypothetical protein
MAERGRRMSIFDDGSQVGAAEPWDLHVADRRQAARAHELGFLDWAIGVPETRGPLDFERFAFQLPLYEDKATTERDLIVKKATQLGLTTWLLRWALWSADVRAAVALYVFPTNATLNAFSQERIGPLLRQGYLATRVGKVNRVELRNIGLGWVYFRGSVEATGLESIAADVLALDEYDSLEPANIGVAEQRVTGPLSQGLIRRVGVPTVPGYGISKLYEGTTQHVWMVKCGCGEHQPIVGSATYRDNLNEATALLECRKCRKPLDVAAGEWVATYPERSTRGYWLSKFIVPGMNLERVVENHRKTAPEDRQTHFNRDLGEEYAPAEGRLSIEALRACQRQELHQETVWHSPKLVTMGVDVASARAFNVRISEHIDDYRKRALWIGTIEWPDLPDIDAPEAVRAIIQRLGALMATYDVKIAAIDHLPETRMARAFAESFPGRVFLVAYNTAQNPTSELWKVDDITHHATVHRTTAIDATLDAFRQQRNLIPMLDELPEEYPEHLGNLIRVAERDEFDRRKVYYRSTGPDDFAQAEVYDLMAGELWYRRKGQQALEQELAPHPTREVEEGPVTGEEYIGESGGGLEEGDWSTGRDWQ